MYIYLPRSVRFSIPVTGGVGQWFPKNKLFMKTNPLFALLLASSIMPTTALEQDVAKKDTVQNTKEVKNRNVMLNASSADQPRQINIGLPSSLSAPIFEDGLPVSYGT